MADQPLEVKRYCRGCGELLVRHHKERNNRWVKRRYCTKGCFNRLHGHKHFHLSRGPVIEWRNPLDRIDDDMIG
jgi:hypothetical protein